jgi:peptidoglycan glycosyltransferase
MERRIRWLGIVMVLCFLGLFVQLNNIQIVKAHALSTSSKNPRVMEVERNDPRGDILSADGIVLASSIPSNGYYKFQRTYNPYTAVLFSQIVGFDSIIYGKTGIEAEYNSYLESHTRPAKTLGDLLTSRTTTGNVTLTITSTLQSQVAQAVNATNVDGGAPVAAAVVLNVKSGAVEAMYSNPPYDPTLLASPNIATEKYTYTSLINDPAQPLLSRTFQGGFLPGSTFKTVTSAAVYDHQPALAKVDYPAVGCISLKPQSPLPLCNYGHSGPNGPEVCGGVLTETLPASCDTAFAQLGMALGGVALTQEAQSFGFNQVPPIDLPGADASTFPSDPGNDPGFNTNKPSQAYSAFGQQNVVATALQMALVADGIANRGVIMTPHVMRDIHDTAGNLLAQYQPKPWLTATNPLTAAAVTSLMQAVVTNGTATQVGFPAAWDVAAKTGTAETGQFNQLTNDWMIAFAPANNPKVAVAVVVPAQPGSDTGASTSGPPMKTILGDALAETP